MTSIFLVKTGTKRPAGSEFFLWRENASRMREMMKKYRDLPMDLVDAALVRVAEREKRGILFLDHRDFRLNRPLRIRRFSFIPAHQD